MAMSAPGDGAPAAESQPIPTRICSLLPSTTEIVGRLGLADRLVAVSHMCDVLHDDVTLPRLVASGAVAQVTACSFDPDAISQSHIDDLIKGADTTGGAPYMKAIDHAAFATARPDLVITQSLCDACAPTPTQVSAACASLIATAAAPDSVSPSYNDAQARCQQPRQRPGPPLVLSLEPKCLLDVADTFEFVGEACGQGARGAALRAHFLGGLQRISDAVASRAGVGAATGPTSPAASSGSGGKSRTAFVLDWLDPPFEAGHWVPEMLQVARGNFDGTSCAGWTSMKLPTAQQAPGSGAPAARHIQRRQWPSQRCMEVAWAAVAAADPDVLIISCCGFDVPRNVQDAQQMLPGHPIAGQLRAVKAGKVFAIDGNRYLPRPGPSLLEGTAALAACLWYDDACIRAALQATGLLPEQGRMWDLVRLDAGGAERG